MERIEKCGFSASQLKAIEISVKFLVDEIADELYSYEMLGMDDAVDTSREVLSELQGVLEHVRSINN